MLEVVLEVVINKRVLRKEVVVGILNRVVLRLEVVIGLYFMLY